MSVHGGPGVGTGADLFARFLVARGVDTVFCITGAGNLALVDACRICGIKVVYSHHEQAAVMEAIGWSRVTGRVGVALVTTGGGAANSLTGILSAHLDSVPLMVVSGNESLFHIRNMSGMRAFGVQGFDSVPVMAPVTKMACRIEGVNEVSVTLSSAFDLCLASRPGPVFIDFPMNLQRQEASSAKEAGIAEGEVQTQDRPASETSSADTQLRTAGEGLFSAQRPLLYFGSGIRSAGAVADALAFAERFQFPFILSWSAIDFCADNHPLNMGRAGIYGDRHVNIAVQRADFLLAVGTRLAIPQVGYDRNDFARSAERWVVDIDASELSKFETPAWKTIQADAKSALHKIQSFGMRKETPPDLTEWSSLLNDLARAFPRAEQVGPPVQDGFIHSYDFVDVISDLASESAIVVTDVGAGLLTGHYGWKVKDGQRVMTSQGLGEMGFGLPGAIGAQIASPERTVICLNTDGGIMFNLQELQLLETYRLGVKVIVFNNGGYTMIRSSQDNLFDGRRNGSEVGSDIGFPDFHGLARAFGMRHTLIDSTNAARKLIPDLLESGNAELIEVRMSPSQLYLPRLSTGKNSDGSFSSPPIEDLTPRLSANDLAGWLPAGKN